MDFLSHHSYPSQESFGRVGWEVREQRQERLITLVLEELGNIFCHGCRIIRNQWWHSYLLFSPVVELHPRKYVRTSGSLWDTGINMMLDLDFWPLGWEWAYFTFRREKYKWVQEWSLIGLWQNVSISLPCVHTFVIWLCIWCCWLFWPWECGRNDGVPVLNLGLKRP